MCLNVYIASSSELALSESDDLSIQELDEAGQPVRSAFSLPHIRYVGAHSGCSCGFPHVVADSPVEWFEGVFDETDEDRPKDLKSVQALFKLISELLQSSEEVQMFPVWVGDEEVPAKGTVDLSFRALRPERFFFTEQFFYRIRR